MCSETSEAVGTTWEHAQLEIQKFLKIRIPLISEQESEDFHLPFNFTVYIYDYSCEAFILKYLGFKGICLVLSVST